jgi:hypothetical protein
MQISALREKVRRELESFAWDQWAQLGVFAPTDRRDRWAADPEALVIWTLEIARSDPRLFDEVLDWLLTNERLLSVQRLRNVCIDDEDRRLVGAALAWVARHRPRKRLIETKTGGRLQAPIPLFRTVSTEVRHPDEVFLQFGFLRPETEPSGKSRPPDLRTPINFAFRMRQLFGVGTRSEIVRYLLTVSAPDVSAQLVAEAAAYAKRNVNETLSALAASEALTTFEIGNERRYYINRGIWGELLALGPETWPTYREWPRLLSAVRRVVRWLENNRLDELSPYMLASEARALMTDLEPDLAFAGVSLPTASSAEGETYWRVFIEAVDRVVAALKTGWS